MSRRFYTDEGPIDTLLQIAAGPVWDGDLVSKPARDRFVALGWVRRCEGYNIITADGRRVISALRLSRRSPRERADNLRAAFIENDIPLGPLS